MVLSILFSLYVIMLLLNLISVITFSFKLSKSDFSAFSPNCVNIVFILLGSLPNASAISCNVFKDSGALPIILFTSACTSVIFKAVDLSCFKLISLVRFNLSVVYVELSTLSAKSVFLAYSVKVVLSTLLLISLLKSVAVPT